MIVDGQKNIKIHFAAAEVINQFTAVHNIGIRYGLYTAFPFLERIVLKTKKSPIMPCFLNDNPFIDIPKYIGSTMRHTIQDSGLFTLMFGAHKGEKEAGLMNRWYDGLVEFTLAHNNGATCVEVDCQKVLGVEKAWEFRERIKKDLPNRIINVFHKEDGQKGLDRLIEFSDYIAISVPELRFLGQKQNTYHLAHYIKNKKPSIDIHLLGCTELKMLKDLKFCSSSDSTSYTAGKRFGFIEGRHIKRLKTDEVVKLVGGNAYENVRKWNKESNANQLCFQIYFLKQQYIKYAGNQD